MKEYTMKELREEIINYSSSNSQTMAGFLCKKVVSLTNDSIRQDEKIEKLEEKLQEFESKVKNFDCLIKKG